MSLGWMFSMGKALRRMGPIEGRLAQMMPTPGSIMDQIEASTAVPVVEEH